MHGISWQKHLMSDKKLRTDLIAESSQIIYDGFIRYNNDFQRITQRARLHFEKRNWQKHQRDIVARIDLYDKSVNRIIQALRHALGDQLKSYTLWSTVRAYVGHRLEKIPDSGFIKTFFNSVTRRIFDTIGVDPQLEFISPSDESDFELAKALNLKRYPCWGSVEKIFQTILEDFAFRVAYSDLAADAARIAQSVVAFDHSQPAGKTEFLRFEFIEVIFYQSSRAYLVGRIILREGTTPIVIIFKNDGSIKVDAVLMSDKEVSIAFGYTRSYCFANPNSVVGAVQFLHSMIPGKPIDELYTMLGRLRQGKTERYRIFTEHLELTEDKFIHAAGDQGLVMIVFTLPSFDMVFKVMRDKFGHPKKISHQEVVRKYKLVAKHDKAGRLIDTQEFRNMEFPVNRFSNALLDELLTGASVNTKIENDNLCISHVYIERRLYPLNLYIREASQKDAELAILDYGQAIKDLAQTNIFPGDLLLKNFGVTRHNRVIFYDYDEVSLITECNFRDLPQADDDIDELRAESWYYVAENDIFPEEFLRFLAMNEELKSLFLKTHGELLSAGYWRHIKAQQLQNKAPPVVPYFYPERNPR